MYFLWYCPWYLLAYLALSMPVFADIAAPNTQADTLRIMRTAYMDHPQITDITVNFEERYVQFQIGDSDPQFSFPDNLHTQLQQAASDAERQDILDHFTQAVIQSTLAIQQDTPINLANVLPVIRHASYGGIAHVGGHTQHNDEHVNLDGEDTPPPTAMLHLPFAADMRIFLVEDAPQFVQFLTENDLLALNMSPEAILKRAIENAATKQKDLSLNTYGGLNVLVLDGNFETSIMMLDSFWAEQDARLGTIVAVVAARDLVLFTESEDTKALADLRTWLVSAGGQINYPVSNTFLTWHQGAWSVYKP